MQPTPAATARQAAPSSRFSVAPVELGCASHNAMWEKNRHILFQASLEWLEKGTVEGQTGTMQRLGFQ